MPEPPRPAHRPREPDSSHVFAMLLQPGMDPTGAYAFVQEMQSMASENLIARIESMLDAQSAELRSFRWFVAAPLVLLGALVTLRQLTLVARGAG